MQTLLILLSPVVCEAQTLGNNLSIGLRTGCLSVNMAGGASDRWWLKVCRI